MDVFKNIGSKIFGQTMKKAAKTAATKAITTAATKTGEHVGKKAGDKIIQMLSKNCTPKKVSFDEISIKPNPTTIKRNLTTIKTNPSQRMTQQDINQRLNFILSDD